MSTSPIPYTAARLVALHTQGLTAPNDGQSPPDREAIYAMVERIGCVQIDTLQMVARAQYLTLWSRLGSYEPADFDALLFDPADRRLFEDWWHAASIIPLKDYRYTLVHKSRFREGGDAWETGWWLSKPENRALMFDVLDRIRNEGALRAADFEGDGIRRGSWWDWKSAKTALEYLWARGDLMIANRVRFNKVYDLTERVMPAGVDRSLPTPDEVHRYRVEQGFRALGLCRAEQAAEYAFSKRGTVRPFVEALRHEGTIQSVQVETTGGTADYVIHRDNLPLLQQALDGTIQAERTTFLSPFDSMFWARGRDVELWNFNQVLEAYKPAPKRIWGYFCLPILHHDRLVGRFDPKLERKNGVLRILALYLEAGVKPDDELVASVAAALRDFLAFHKAREMVIEESDPPAFGKKLMAAL